MKPPVCLTNATDSREPGRRDQLVIARFLRHARTYAGVWALFASTPCIFATPTITGPNAIWWFGSGILHDGAILIALRFCRIELLIGDGFLGNDAGRQAPGVDSAGGETILETVQPATSPSLTSKAIGVSRPSGGASELTPGDRRALPKIQAAKGSRSSTESPACSTLGSVWHLASSVIAARGHSMVAVFG